MFPFVTEALAQEATGTSVAANPLVQFIPFVLIFVVFYFLIIRPQYRKQKSHQTMLVALKKGDRVVTSGGIFGTIHKLGEDQITLEISDKVRIQVERAQIARLAQESVEKDVEKQPKEPASKEVTN